MSEGNQAKAIQSLKTNADSFVSVLYPNKTTADAERNAK